MVEVRRYHREEYGKAIYGIGQYFGAAPTEERPRALREGAPARADARGARGRRDRRRRRRVPVRLSVPGRRAPCGGVTVVGVSPTHRRRGVLRAMMDAQLRDIHERGEPIAALWASEETIYGRFGYGIAAWAARSSSARVDRVCAAAGAARPGAVRRAGGGARSSSRRSGTR